MYTPSSTVNLVEWKVSIPVCGAITDWFSPWLLSEVIRVTFFYSYSCSCSKKSDSCSGTHWKFTLQLLFALQKLEGIVYCASWGKITTILPLTNMDKLCHGFSAGKQSVGTAWLLIQNLTVNQPIVSLCHIVIWPIQLIMFSEKQNNPSTVFLSWGKKDTTKLETKK